MTVVLQGVGRRENLARMLSRAGIEKFLVKSFPDSGACKRGRPRGPEEKLMSGHIERFSPKLQRLIGLLRKCGLLRLTYSIWRYTMMDGWHFMLIPKS